MTQKQDGTNSTPSKSNVIFALVPIFFGLIWFLLVVPTYVFHHPYYSQSISQFRYWGLLGGVSILLTIAYLFFTKNKAKWSAPNGWKLYILFLLTLCVILSCYVSRNGLFNFSVFSHLPYFIGFMVLLHLAILYITILGYALGEILLRPLSGQLSTASFFLIAIALGWSVLAFIMVLLGQLQILNPFLLWATALAVTILRNQSIRRFLQILLFRPLPINDLKNHGLIPVAFLFIFLGVNAIGAVKAFPSGFDGAGLYMNITKLIGEYQALPAGGQAYNWSVLMSTGNLLFGHMTVAILLANLIGFYCFLAVYRIARLFVSCSSALLAGVIFYITPALAYHNYVDEKVDLGFLFISLCTLLLLLEFYKNKQKRTNLSPLIKIGSFSLSDEMAVWILVGWLTGFAFGIKYSALFNIIALTTFVFYKNGGRFAFIGSLLLAFSSLFLLGIHQFAGLELNGTSPFLLGSILFIPGVALIGRVYRHSFSRLLRAATIIGVFAAVITLNYAPWAMKHVKENRSISLSAIVEGKSPEPKVRIKKKYRKKQPIKSYDQPRKIKEANTTSAQQTRREELQRYLGFEKGLPLYLSLPYDLTMNTNIVNQSYLDIGFLWLLLIPLFLLSVKPKLLWKNILMLFFLLFFLLISIQAVFIKKPSPITPEEYLERHSESFQSFFGSIFQSSADGLIQLSERASTVYVWLSGFGFMQTLLVLIGLLFFVIWLASEKIKMMPVLFKCLLAFTTVYFFIWFILGSGVPWYAFLVVAILPVLAVYYYERPALIFGEGNKRFAVGFLALCFGIYFILSLGLHFHDANRRGQEHLIYQSPFLEFASQNRKSDEIITLFNPAHTTALQYLNQNPTEKIYRIGTFLNYHISQNDTRVLEDNQLGKFSEITSKLSDPNYFLSVLRDQGFRYILYDLNTATIDRTPEQSLKKKNNEFINRISKPNAIKLLVTDRIIEDSNNLLELQRGNKVKGRYGLSGNIVYGGTFALFEIL